VEPSPPPGSAPTRRRRDWRGQATVDYTALLAVVAVVFAGVGAVTGLAEVPKRVVRAFRTGICIVGGDICRASDAAAAGLDPCIVAEKSEGSGVTLAVALFRMGRGGEWSAARRSDGTVLVTHSDDGRVGAGMGVGFELGHLGIGADGSIDLTATKGEAWELPDVAAASSLIEAIRSDKPHAPPTWRFGDGGQEGNARVGIDALDFEVTGFEASWRAAAGVRTGRGERTIYVDANTQLTGPLDNLPGSSNGPWLSSAAPGGTTTGPVLVAVTRDARGLKEIAFRAVRSGNRKNQVVETVARLDLRDPDNRALAERLLRFRAPWPPAIARDLRAVLRRTLEVGTVERAVYAVDDRSHAFAAGARLAVELGIETSNVDVMRRLVSATAWTRGSPERAREDCVEAA
jgi:hypothetical protein